MTGSPFPTALMATATFAAALLIVGPAFAAKIGVFDPPDSDDTYASAINRDGEVAGFFDILNGNRHAFLRATDGTITTFDPPNSYWTWAVGINDAGVIAGYFDERGGSNAHAPYSDLQHGYVRTPDGTFTSFDPPGCDYTTVAGINRNGDVAGDSEDSNEAWMYHGFLRTADGTITTFDPAGSITTSVYALNSQDAVVGTWEDNHANLHGFIRKSGGKIADIDVPGANTIPTVINDKGTIAGVYFVGNQDHAFLRLPSGTISTIDPPGATFVQVYGINNRGEIAGDYWGQTGPSHGFIRSSGGGYKTFDAKGAYGTEVYGINARGDTVGFYDDGMEHGFVRMR